MEDKTFIMKKEIRLISGYRALMISRYVMSICLIMSSYYVGVKNYAMSPLYILLLLNIFPTLLAFIIKDYAGKYQNRFLLSLTVEHRFLLTCLKRKYHYNHTAYAANTLSFYFSLFLLILWNNSFRGITGINRLTLLLPGSILIIGVLLRLIGGLIYRIKLHYDVSNNRV